MSFIDDARGKLTEARNELLKRLRGTDNTDDRGKIDDAITEINGTLGLLNQSDSLEVANAAVDATVAIERLVSGARLSRFDDYLGQLATMVNNMSDLLSHCDLMEHLERAPAVFSESESTDGTTTGPEAGSTTIVSPPSTQAVCSTRDFNVLAAEYQDWVAAMSVREEYKQKVDWHIKMLLKYQERYREVGQSLNGVPWSMVGVIHAMECGFNFACHLHNGDPLTARTTHVPAGRPQDGEPPFSWEKSAADALNGEGFRENTDWSIPHMLYLLEKYNGFGYRKISRPTPYLWSFSNLYEKGKYVADCSFDPEAVSKQCGAAVMLKTLLDQSVVIV